MNEQMDTEDWKSYRAERAQERRQQGLVEVRHILASGVKYTDRPTAMLFRDLPKRSADFYPTTCRWKDNLTGKYHKGGALRFLAWWKDRA